MKAHIPTVLFVALLLATGRLAAHTAAPATSAHVPAHEHPAFTSVSTRFELNDGTTIEWIPVPGAPEYYDVKVTQVRPAPGITKIYSLLTFGIQSIRGDNEAELKSGTDVMIYVHGNPTGSAWGASRPLAKAGQGSSGQLDPNMIMFISFSSRTCEMRVKAVRPGRPGNSVWDPFPPAPAFLSGHDNTPPDGYPPI